jgi:hypothetical protein
VVERFLGPRAAEVFYKRRGQPAWLILTTGSGPDDADSAMMVFPTERAWESEVALFRTTVKVPLLTRKATGGAFGRLDPVGDAEYAHLCGPGWFAFKEPRGQIPSALFERLCLATQILQEAVLGGVALYDRYLAVWADAANLRKLLAAGSKIRSKIFGR